MDKQIFQPGDAVKIYVFAPVEKAFDYLVGESTLEIGSVVEVPFGARNQKGVVWGSGEVRPALKSVAAKLNYPAMRPEMRAFIETMAGYTITPIGQILRMAYRAGEALEPKPNALRPVEGFEGSLTPKRSKLLEELRREKILPLEAVEASKGIIRALVDQGAAEFVILDAPAQISRGEDVELSADQKRALSEIRDAKEPVVLKGVTGSGKTEIYLEAVAQTIESGGQTLVLLPEIALTSAFLQRFEARFGFAAGHWHSAMSGGDRRRIWHDVANSKTPVVIGARSALFLPFKNLQLITVDEEHDKGYKQEEGVIYNGRDMAVLRAYHENAKVILASATPSVETMFNAENGRYTRVDLEQRFGAAKLPKMQVIDMRDAGLDANHWISPAMLDAIRSRMEIGEQSLLFLNRRGFAPLTLCRACGHQIACPNCDARLVEHRHRGGLHCHQCGYQMAIPKACPNCKADEKLVPIGPGVERLGEEVQAAIPEAKICILSSDIAGGEEALRAELSAIEHGEYDVIIGTQMVAKGHNFPALTLVGIVDADIGLEGADLRAAEQSFQILHQVSGRAGRQEKPGLALIQSYQPDHPILRAIMSNDDTQFYRDEIERRREATAPPFTRYIAIVIWANQLEEAMQIGRNLLRNGNRLSHKHIQIWGPTPAPIARIRNRWRVRMLLKMPKSMALHREVHDWVKSIKTASSVKIQIDVDPQSFL